MKEQEAKRLINSLGPKKSLKKSHYKVTFCFEYDFIEQLSVKKK